MRLRQAREPRNAVSFAFCDQPLSRRRVAGIVGDSSHRQPLAGSRSAPEDPPASSACAHRLPRTHEQQQTSPPVAVAPFDLRRSLRLLLASSARVTLNRTTRTIGAEMAETVTDERTSDRLDEQELSIVEAIRTDLLPMMTGDACGPG